MAAQEQALALSRLGVRGPAGEGESLGCLLSFQERFRLFQVVAAVAVDESGDLDPGGLQGMILGSTRTQRVLTFSAFVDVFLSVQVDLCSGRLLSFCVGGAEGFELPNFPGIPTTARGGCRQTSSTTTESASTTTWRSMKSKKPPGRCPTLPVTSTRAGCFTPRFGCLRPDRE